MGSYNPEFPKTLSGLTGWYTGDSVVGNPMTQWTDISGNNRHITPNGTAGADISGSILTQSTGGGLVSGPRPFIYGDTNAKMRFPTTVLASGYNDYTFFHVSRYYVPQQITYAYDDQLTTTPFTGTLSGNTNNGPATRVTSSTANGGYIEMCHSGTSRIGCVSWQLTMGDSWEVDAEIYINPITYGGADDIRFIFYATNPITTTDAPTGTNGHGGHYIRWEYYNGDLIEIYNSTNTNLSSVATTLNMNQWMPIKITYVNGYFTATIKNSSGTVLSNGTRTYYFGTTFSSYHNTPKYFGFSGRSGGVQARDRVRNIYFRSLPVPPALTRLRIWDGVSGNWLSGFHSGESGVAHHGGWTTTNTSVDVHGNDWVFSTDQRFLYRSNGVTRGSGIGGGTSEQLSINSGVYTTSQTSTFAVAEVIVYNRTLSSSEYTSVEDYLNKKYTATLDLQSIGTDAVDTPPYSLSEYYNEPFADGTFAPSSGPISIFSFIGPFIGVLNPKGLGVPSVAGQQIYTSPGTYYFTVPSGVTSLSCVVIGGGGGSSGCSGASQFSGAGGGGGGLAYGTFSVTPGQQVTVGVGAGGTRGTNVNSTTNVGGTGGFSYIQYAGSYMLRAYGGGGGRYGYTTNANPGGPNIGSGVTLSGGGSGGYGGGGRSNNGGGGGGGAGGYGGNGGNGGIGNSGSGGSGSGGAGGGGGGQASGGTQNNGGGGTGLNGQGANGAGGVRNSNGKGGSGGGNGVYGGNGGTYGAGAGGCEDDTNRVGSYGAGGAVRIIWGNGRAYPSTNTADV